MRKENKNPFNLVWYNANWPKTKIEKNNMKYWQWENNKKSQKEVTIKRDFDYFITKVVILIGNFIKWSVKTPYTWPFRAGMKATLSIVLLSFLVFDIFFATWF